MLREKTGFTLIELMLVVIIIGTLVAMVVPSFVGRSEEAKVVAARADIEANLGVALDMFEMDNNFYPTTEQGLRALWQKPAIPPVPTNWRGPYIKKPIIKDPWNHPYVYVCPGVHNANSYDLVSCGKDGAEGGEDDIVNWSKEE